MNREEIIRSWKDEEYRASLPDSDRASLPEHPAGVIHLPESLLQEVAGGFQTERMWTFGCCFGTVGVGTKGCCLPEHES